MLLRIDEEFVIKTDRYCFMICKDKGMTKFPNGVEALYYSPVKYCRTLGSTIGVTTTHDGGHHDLISIFDGHELPNDYVTVCEEEGKLISYLNEMSFNDRDDKIFGCKIKKCRNYYIAECGRRIFPTTYGSAIFCCYLHHLREDSKFGMPSGDDLFEGDWKAVLEAIEETKRFAESKIIDKNEVLDKK